MHPIFAQSLQHKGFTVQAWLCAPSWAETPAAEQQVSWGNWAALDSNQTPLPKDTAECQLTALKIGR